VNLNYTYETSIDLKCFLSSGDSGSTSTNSAASTFYKEPFKYCYRRLYFKLYGIVTNGAKRSKITNGGSEYAQIATIFISDLDSFNTKLTFNISMPNNYTFMSTLNPETSRSMRFLIFLNQFLYFS
jgi:hypothetical protein